MNDVLYILGSGSKDSNNELRYSLRSLEKHLINYNNVYVVGENPEFISENVKYYFVPEAKGNKEYRIAKKIQWACNNIPLSSDFLFMNDDIFFTSKVDATDYPFKYKGDLSAPAPDKRYYRSLLNTRKYLKSKGFNTYHFDVHTPIVYNVEKFLSLSHIWKDSYRNMFGFVVKSIYCNFHGIEGQIYEDVKLSELSIEAINKNDCFSCSDAGWENGVREYLTKQYPNKSRYEK